VLEIYMYGLLLVSYIELFSIEHSNGISHEYSYRD